jgi:hypothetical protein
VEPEFKTVEISIKFLGDDYKNTREIYVQRLNFHWYFQNRPTLVQQIVAVVNELEFPSTAMGPGSWREVK